VKLSTKGRYGTRALLDLASHYEERIIQLKDVAKRQQISLRYLEQLVTPLIAGGIVRSTRGAGGGVSLARPPREINLSEAFKLLEGSTALVECIDNPEICERSGLCVTRDVWSELKIVIDGVLGDTTLQDLVDRQRQKDRHESSMYYI